MRMYEKKEIGERIRKKRKALGITQFELAERIGRAPKYCADIERGTCGMSLETMLAICEALHMSPNMLLLGEAVAAFDDAAQGAQYISALQDCTAEQRDSIFQIIRLFAKSE